MRDLMLVVCLSSCLAGNADEPATEKYFDPHQRIPWTNSRVVGTPEPPPPFRLERVFPQLKFNQPVYLVAEPGSRRWLVVERTGTVYRWTDGDEANKEKFLELGHESYSLVFHPAYAKNGTFFVFRNLLKDKKNSQNQVTRFQTTLDDRRVVRPESAEVVIEWEARGHNGGDMAFGPDGLLYLSSGDGETGVDDPDPGLTGQDLSDLRGGILRIDVDRRDEGKPYAIPADNPFVRVSGARPELWAFGLRNPWRISFDDTGRLWIGDNGEESWESIYLGQRGANYGWSVLEGGRPFNLARPAAPYPFVPPVVSHSHAESRSIMGGRVYRGPIESLRGVYVYGDHETGKIWGLRHDGRQVTWRQELADTKRKLITFAEDRGRDLLVVTFDGEIFRLVPRLTGGDTAEFPRRLSQTGLFASVPEYRPANGLIPYSVNAPAWADGATVERHVAIPGDGRIKYQPERGWEFADGSVIVQTFSLDQRRIETRLLHRNDGDWHGYSYRWTDDQTDAELVAKEGATRTSPNWQFPGRTQCMVCHSFWGPRFVIGLATEQMNRVHDYGGTRENQLDVLTRLNILDGPARKPAAELQKLAEPHDRQASLTARARAYLHANCAHCHRYSGAGNARMRLGYELSVAETRAFDLPPEHGGFGLRDARLIASSSPDRSVIYYRMAKRGRGHMPPLGPQTPDVDGLNLLHDWFSELPLATGKPDVRPTGQSIDELLSTTSGALTLIDSLNRGRLEQAERSVVIAKGTAHSDRNIRDLFERFLPPDRQSQRLGDAVQPDRILKLTGNAEQGQRLFLEPTLQCKSCHRVAGQGNGLGPDLDRLPKKYTRAELLESVLEPSKVVDPKFQAVSVTTSSGQVLSGLLVEKTREHLLLRDAQNNSLRIPIADAESVQPQKKSFMPDGLLRELTPQEAADLVEFLFLLGQRE